MGARLIQHLGLVEDVINFIKEAREFQLMENREDVSIEGMMDVNEEFPAIAEILFRGDERQEVAHAFVLEISLVEAL